VKVVHADLSTGAGLADAVREADVVVHCAGKTKAVRSREYYDVNTEGTRRLVEACVTGAPRLKQFVLLSSLAAVGPGTLESPAREDDLPCPVTHYGRSKLLAEEIVREKCPVPSTVLRPAAVYGPGDVDFLVVFKAIARGVAPLVKGGLQPLSLIYAADVAKAVGQTVERESAVDRAYHLGHPVPITGRQLVATIADVMGAEPLRVSVPSFALYPVFGVCDLLGRITGRPSIMNLQKVPEYAAPGWVCATARAAAELHFTAQTRIEDGAEHTMRWYVENGWLRAGKG
jgi:nucleoside-diphosphate-sugar epimerase